MVVGHFTQHHIGELTALVKTRLRRMQYQADLIDGCLAKTGLDLGKSRD